MNSNEYPTKDPEYNVKLNILKDPRVVKFGLGSWSRSQSDGSSLGSSKSPSKRSAVSKTNQEHQERLLNSFEKDEYFNDFNNSATAVSQSRSTHVQDGLQKSNVSSASVQTDDFHVLWNGDQFDIVTKNNRDE